MYVSCRLISCISMYIGYWTYVYYNVVSKYKLLWLYVFLGCACTCVCRCDGDVIGKTLGYCLFDLNCGECDVITMYFMFLC